MVPVGETIISEYPDMHPSDNGTLPQPDLFLYTAREIQSAPAGTLKRSDSTYSSNSSISSKSSKSPSKEKKRSKKGKCGKSWNLTWEKVFFFFFCHAPEFTAWATSFSSISRIKYISLFFVESVFRSIGDVTFCSNPFSGLLIFIGMLLSRPKVAFLAFITLTFGIETAVVFLRVPMDEVRSGVVLFNNFLTGTVIGLLAHDDVIMSSPQIIPICMGMGILTAIIWQGLNGILASRLEFPLLNAPFHVIILLYIFSGIAGAFKLAYPAIHTQEIQELPISVRNLTFGENATPNNKNLVDISGLHEPPLILKRNNGMESLNWMNVLCGICLAPSQVFGTNSILTSLLVYTSILLYSPIMLMQSLTGASVGTMIGICLSSPEDYKYLYNGSWGYNSLFTSAALGGLFLIYNVHSWLLSIVGSIITALLYSAMVKCHVPALGIPFMLTTWLLLPSALSDQERAETKNDMENDNCTGKSRPLPKKCGLLRLRLSDITTPELNRRRFYRESTNCNNDKYSQTQHSSTPQQNAILPL